MIEVISSYTLINAQIYKVFLKGANLKKKIITNQIQRCV